MTAGTVSVPVVDLRKRVGERRRVTKSIPVGPLAVGVVSVPTGSMATIDIELESMQDGIEAVGSVETTWVGECRRCLEPIEAPLVLAIHERFADPRTTEGFDEAEMYPIADDHVDLGPLIDEAILLGLPLSPLCGTNCAGPDPERFPAVTESAEPTPDPRWAALSEIKFDE